MPSFHVLHWIPDRRLHILNGYNEVIETVIWGLRALGHEVTYGVNLLQVAAIPIVFGAQLMPPDTLAQLPASSVIYNLEQLAGLRAAGRALDDLAAAARRCTVWDYSTANLEIWRELGVSDASHLPIGFAPCLHRIAKPVDQDIDVLIYGAPSSSRFVLLAELCARGLSAMFFCGLYGEARDILVARAKIVLCLTSNSESSIFSIVRASYLLANRKAVVGDYATIERDIVAGVALAPPAGVADLCGRLIEEPALRCDLEDRGFEVIAKRDIRPLLARALDRACFAAVGV